MRTFIAIDFSSSLKRNILGMQEIIRKNSISGHWRATENFHITMLFNGEVPEGSLQKYYDRILSGMSEFQEFDIAINKVGGFGVSGNSMRILLLALEQTPNTLNGLHNYLRLCSDQEKIPYDQKPILPHITLGSDVVLKEPVSEILEKNNLKDFKFSMKVREISIFKSEQINKRRVYTQLQKFGLSKLHE